MQMGMWNGFQPEFWQKYESPLLGGIEASQFPCEDNLPEISRFCQMRGLRFGVHTPILAQSFYSLPRVSAKDRGERKEALERIGREAQLAARYGADYILFHFPFPSVFPSVQEPAYLAGMPAFERYESREIEPGFLRDCGERLLDAIAEIQLRTGQRIVLEYDFFGDEWELFDELFGRYPDVGLVADLQRLDVHRRVFPEFDPYRWLEQTLPHLYVVHHSNTRFEDGKWHRHLPVLPEHDAAPDYGDAFAYMRFIAESRPEVHVTFEHNPALVSREELQRCYESVHALCG
nr:TIM barrel protein [Paenibacillus hamazuiensis]